MIISAKMPLVYFFYKLIIIKYLDKCAAPGNDFGMVTCQEVACGKEHEARGCGVKRGRAGGFVFPP
jgi:hypothetical protein